MRRDDDEIQVNSVNRIRGGGRKRIDFLERIMLFCAAMSVDWLQISVPRARGVARKG